MHGSQYGWCKTPFLDGKKSSYHIKHSYLTTNFLIIIGGVRSKQLTNNMNEGSTKIE